MKEDLVDLSHPSHRLERRARWRRPGWVMASFFLLACQVNALGGTVPEPILHWTFNENPGGIVSVPYVYDVSPAGHSPVPFDAATLWSGDFIGPAGAFAPPPGETDGFRVEITEPVVNDCSSGSDPCSVQGTYSLWVKPAGFQSRDQVLVGATRPGNNLSWFLRFPQNSLRVNFHSGTDVTTATGVPAAAWSHIAVTFDDNQVEIYLDGVPAGSGAAGISHQASTGFIVGDSPNGFAQFEGEMDDVRVFDRVLSAAEIQSLHSEGLALASSSDETPPLITVSATDFETSPVGDASVVLGAAGEEVRLHVLVQGTGAPGETVAELWSPGFLNPNEISLSGLSADQGYQGTFYGIDSSGNVTVDTAAFKTLPKPDVIYVSTTGGAAGSGTLSDPIDLGTALRAAASGGPARPGDTIYLLPGLYQRFVPPDQRTKIWPAGLVGSALEPIVLRPLPGSGFYPVVIENGLEGPLAYVTVQDLQFTTTLPVPDPGQTHEQQETELGTAMGLVNQAGGFRIVNCFIFGMYSVNSFGGPESEAYGNLVYDYGRCSSDHICSFYGHAFYAQNSGPGRTLIENNIIRGNTGYAVHVFSDGTGSLDGIDAIGNIVYETDYGLITRGSNPTGINFSSNILNGVNIDADFVSDLTIDDNHITSGQVSPRWSRGMSLRGNTLVGENRYIQGPDGEQIYLGSSLEIRTPNGEGNPVGYVINANDYRGTSFVVGWYRFGLDLPPLPPYCRPEDNFCQLGFVDDFTAWQMHWRMDNHSTWQLDIPSGFEKKVLPNRYDSGRGTLVVHNWDRLPGAVFDERDLQPVLEVGDRYVIYNVRHLSSSLNAFQGVLPVVGDLSQPAIYSGGDLSIPTEAIPGDDLSPNIEVYLIFRGL